MMTRKLVTDQKQIDQSCVFEGDVDSVIANLTRLREEIIAQYPEAIDYGVKIIVDYYGYDGGRDYEMQFQRFETDNEMKDRMKLEAESKKRKAVTKKAKEDKERAEYERLKAKFGE